MTSQEENKLPDNTPRKKKLKKRSSKEKGKALNKEVKAKDALWGLQILPKSEWKALRNKYLNLQRKYMKEIKSNLYDKRNAYSGIPEPAAPSMDVEPGMFFFVLVIKERIMHNIRKILFGIFFYLQYFL